VSRETLDFGGELSVRVGWDGWRVRHAEVRSTRPFAARRILADKRTEDVAAIVPLLFSICRRAQSAAASCALAAANGKRGASMHGASVLLETLQEHVSHLLLDVPRAMRQDAAIEPVAGVRKRIERLLSAMDADGGRIDPASLHEAIAALETIAANEIYGMAPARWLNLGAFGDLSVWAGRRATLPAKLLADVLRETPALGASEVALMPPMFSEAMLSLIVPAMRRETDFARAPTIQGAPVETGALARMREHRLVSAVARHCSNGVAARLVARLLELASLLRDAGRLPSIGDESPSIRTLTIAPGEGIAAVQTARGVLLHRARVDDGRVADYQIVAPTEWNFHPKGALVRGIDRMVARDPVEVERRAMLVAQTLDPCVAFRVEVGNA
jgi:hypothetical protein